ncbi:hypothetical protein [Pseudomonas sp. Irchel s3b6]|uniref:hypothetical protein n=1 Tax=Pseudomonas sp. Irchel s3b6 TaxID=2009078 RepID=UPI000BA4DE7C|nr:hypothetical protein [Pseudomonas sp. Irchel s3b6]
MNVRVLILVLLILLTVRVANAQEQLPQTKISGWVSLIAGDANEAFSDEKTVLGGRGHVDVQFTAGTLQSVFRAELPSDDNLGDNSSTSLLREGWVRKSGESYDLTLGRQFLPEGRSDWLHPQGQFSPRDYTQLTTVDTEQKIGLPALRLDLYSTETTVTLAAIRQDRGDILPEAMVSSLSEDQPLQKDPVDAGLARVEWRNGPWELGASYLHGSALYPVMDRRGEVSAYRQQRVATDGSVNLDGDILRWDVAYIRNDSEAYPGMPEQEWLATLGLDKGIWKDGTLSLQLIHHHSNLPDSEGLPLLESYNQRLSQNFRKRQSWLTLNLRQQFDGKRDAELGYMQGQKGENIGYLRYGWGFKDGWRLNVQSQFAHGELDSLGGNFIPEKIIFMELRHFF